MTSPKHAVSVLSLALLFALGLGGCEMDSFLFNTQSLDAYHPPASIPSELLEPVTFQSDGNTLYGYWLNTRDTSRRMTILYCHGNRHNMDEYWDRVEFLGRLGVRVFTFDYRGFGRSEGVSSQEGMYADAEAALAQVLARGAAADSIVLYGFSLGNVASIHLAANRITPRAIIAESPFASSTSLVQGGIVLDFPARWLTDGTFDNAAAVRKITAPLLVLHGEEDDFVRYRDNGRVVYDAANDPRKLIAVPGATHTNVPQTMGVEEYLEEVREWVR